MREDSYLSRRYVALPTLEQRRSVDSLRCTTAVLNNRRLGTIKFILSLHLTILMIETFRRSAIHGKSPVELKLVLR